MTEFSVSLREMQENYEVCFVSVRKHGIDSYFSYVYIDIDFGSCHIQLMEFQQRTCIVIFDLSCNLARVLEFCAREIPQAFVSGTDTNLRRLAELIVFILTHFIGAIDPEVFDQ